MFRALTNLQQSADSKKTAAPYTWDAVSNMMKNVTGQKVDYDSFKKLIDSGSRIKDLVDNFDERGLVLKTDVKLKPKVQVQKTSTSGIDASAKRAAANTLSRPG